MKIPLRFDRFMLARYAGILLLLAGALLQIVESFVLTSEATSFLIDQYGNSPSSAKGSLQRMMVESGSHRFTITPPQWIRWSTLSVGLVLLAYGVWARRWK